MKDLQRQYEINVRFLPVYLIQFTFLLIYMHIYNCTSVHDSISCFYLFYILFITIKWRVPFLKWFYLGLPCEHFATATSIRWNGGSDESISAVWLQLKSRYITGHSTGFNHRFGSVYLVMIAKLSAVIPCSWFVTQFRRSITWWLPCCLTVNELTVWHQKQKFFMIQVTCLH